MAILTRALSRLHSDFNTLAPSRDKTTDGWIGDLAHQQGVSGHNPDDTPGSKSEYSDADSVPEVRAIDVDKDLNVPGLTMLMCIQKILATPQDRDRLKYIIFNRVIWSKSTGWTPHTYTGSNPHDKHAHFSGDPAHDEDDSPWSILHLQEGAAMYVNLNDSGPFVVRLQLRLKNLGYNIGSTGADGKYGPATKTALKGACVAVYPEYKGDGGKFGPSEEVYLDVLWARKYGGYNQVAGLETQVKKLEERVANAPVGEGFTFPMTVTINKVD